ncbi:MAG TPA: 50S ribosomal protein L29 [Candidatus Paceibacterota bacterium]
MKIDELKDKKPEDLTKILYEKREELRALKSNISGSKVRNVKAVGAIKKDIARILTAHNSRS